MHDGQNCSQNLIFWLKIWVAKQSNTCVKNFEPTFVSQIGHFAVEEKVPFLARKWADAQTKRAFMQITFQFRVLFICFGAQSFVHFSAQTQLCLKKLFMWFQWFIGSKLWPNNTVNTKFCVEIFLGARMSQPPQNALYHTVQMVLVDRCDRLISCFS